MAKILMVLKLTKNQTCCSKAEDFITQRQNSNKKYYLYEKTHRTAETYFYSNTFPRFGLPLEINSDNNNSSDMIGQFRNKRIIKINQ